MVEGKQKLETDNRNNKEIQSLIQENNKMEEQIAELETDTEEIIYDLWASRKNLEQKVKLGRKAKQK